MFKSQSIKSKFASFWRCLLTWKVLGCKARISFRKNAWCIKVYKCVDVRIWQPLVIWQTCNNIFVCRRETLTTIVDMTNTLNRDSWPRIKRRCYTLQLGPMGSDESALLSEPFWGKMTQLISKHPIKSQWLFSHRFIGKKIQSMRWYQVSTVYNLCPRDYKYHFVDNRNVASTGNTCIRSTI